MKKKEIRKRLQEIRTCIIENITYTEALEAVNELIKKMNKPSPKPRKISIDEIREWIEAPENRNEIGGSLIGETIKFIDRGRFEDFLKEKEKVKK